MAKPLRSEDPSPRDLQFKTFGVLDDGHQSKGAFTTSIVANILLALLAVIIGSAVKHIVAPKDKKDVAFIEPIKELPKPKPPPPPKLPPPPKMPPPPETPKIKLPDPPKLPELKIPEVKMPTPEPVKLAPAPPKAITPPPAPVHIANLNPQAAAVKNNDMHPSAVRLGAADNPLKSLNGPAVSKVNFGNAGAAGMPSSNTGNGPHAVSLGNGSTASQNLNGSGRGPTVVAGFRNGIPGGTGRPGGTAPQAVNIASMGSPAARAAAPTVERTASSPPRVTYKPIPVYTEEARAAHVEGAVSLKIRVSASGAVEVLGVTRSLGHGLDQAAIKVAEGMHFQPAKDSTGQPVDWTGVVNVNFQMT